MQFKMALSVISVVIFGVKILIKNQMVINFERLLSVTCPLPFPYNAVLTHHSEKIIKKIYFESCVFMIIWLMF